jgi:hypothetical protein
LPPTSDGAQSRGTAVLLHRPTPDQSPRVSVSAPSVLTRTAGDTDGRPAHLEHALADATRALIPPSTRRGLEGTLEAIAHAARDAVPGFDHVGITVIHSDGAVATMASTGQLVRKMDTLQYELSQGPCMDALRREALVLVEDLATQEHNWP